MVSSCSSAYRYSGRFIDRYPHGAGADRLCHRGIGLWSRAPGPGRCYPLMNDYLLLLSGLLAGSLGWGLLGWWRQRTSQHSAASPRAAFGSNEEQGDFLRVLLETIPVAVVVYDRQGIRYSRPTTAPRRSWLDSPSPAFWWPATTTVKLFCNTTSRW